MNDFILLFYSGKMCWLLRSEPCQKAERVLSGRSKAKVMPRQDCVAFLFYKGFSGLRTPTGNMRSVDKYLMHYDTIEAVRLSDGTVIYNEDCYSRGYAKCSFIYTLDNTTVLPISTILRLGLCQQNDLIDMLENNEVRCKKELISRWVITLLTTREKGVVFSKRTQSSYRYFKVFDDPGEAEKEFNRLVKISRKLSRKKTEMKSLPLSLIKELLGLNIEIIKTRYSAELINGKWHPVERFWDDPNIELEGNTLKIYVSNPVKDRLILQDIFVDHYNTGRGNVAKLLVIIGDKIWDIALVGRDPTGQAWLAYLPFNYWLAGIDACERWVMNIPNDAEIVDES